jgi:hypothetical protein
MKLRAIVTVLFFITAISTGSVLAADRGETTADPARNGGYDDGSETRGGALEPRPGTPMAGPDQDRQDEFFQAGDGDRIAGMHRADKLVGQNVNSRQGDNLGSIDDLIISENGQVEFIVLSRGGTLGMGGELVPVPWEAANLQKDQDDQLTADITEQQLEEAPSFDDYAQFGEQEQQVHSYFGTQSRTDGNVQ